MPTAELDVVGPRTADLHPQQQSRHFVRANVIWLIGLVSGRRCFGNARPFGEYWVKIITPLRETPSQSEMKLLNDYSDPLAYLREIDDPLGETLILIEVTWPTNPWPLPNG